MASLRTSTGRGFTLIEMLVVIGLLAIIGTIALVLSFDSYRAYSFRSDRDLIIATLQKARSQAVNGVCLSTLLPCSGGVAHGVHIDSNQLVIFQGTSYNLADPANEIVALTSSATEVSLTGEPKNIVFSELAGNATVDTPGNWSVTVRNTTNGQTSVITFNTAGQITWTN